MITWVEAIDQLRSIGYIITLKGGNLQYIYLGKDKLIKDQIAFLIEVLKSHKNEILNDPSFLIDETIKEINGAWEPGVLAWLKGSRRNEWQRILTIEGKINQFAFENDIYNLKQSLENYKNLLLSLIKIYKSSYYGRNVLFRGK